MMAAETHPAYRTQPHDSREASAWDLGWWSLPSSPSLSSNSPTCPKMKTRSVPANVNRRWSEGVTLTILMLGRQAGLGRTRNTKNWREGSTIQAVCQPHGWDKSSRVTRRYLLSTVPLRLLKQQGTAGWSVLQPREEQTFVHCPARGGHAVHMALWGEASVSIFLSAICG